MKMIFKILGSCLLFSILALGCAEDGEPGPQGEQGEKGDQGEQGDQGEKGDAGTANVVYSDWLESEFGVGVSYSSYLFTEIDNDLYPTNTTVFLVYCKEEPSDIVNPLPMQLDETVYSFFVEPPRSETPTIARIFLYRDGTPPENLPLGRAIPTHFRYVIIPGGVNAGGRMGQPDFNDYEAVKRFYNLPD